MESFRGAVFGGMRVLQQNFGSVKVCFGDAVSMQDFRKSLTKKRDAAAKRAGDDTKFDPAGNKQDCKAFNTELAYDVLGRLRDLLSISPTALVSALMLNHRHGVAEEVLQEELDWLRTQVLLRGGAARPRPPTRAAPARAHPRARTQHNTQFSSLACGLCTVLV